MQNNDNEYVKDILTAAAPLLSAFLDFSVVLLMIILDREGRILRANQTLSRCLKVDRAELTGRSFASFLTGPDGEGFAKRLAGTDTATDEEFLLNLVDVEQVPHTLRCRLAMMDERFLLIGEPPQDNNQSLQEELLQLNNKLSVLSRENVRKGRELTKALADLKSTQSMLVQQEKMASLGQMTAGIAHEINNPLAFVLNNEQLLKRDFDELLAFINTLGDAMPEIALLSASIHGKILAKAGEVGLEYLAEAVPRKITANIEGLERVKRIVLDLRNFSRLDEADRKLCNPADGIESTIRFLGPLMQEYGVTIETDFTRSEQLFCSPGLLNQAISNILANAIQASQPGQTVRVSTRQDGDWYCIEIRDQGSGIPAEYLTKVFDPFFTTKPVGSGTGLGLSIAHQIVADQGGRIEIDSIPGSGATFRILLRFEQQDAHPATER
ncbi:MAG: PAS domain-containing protein [Deltaproteobacteria bacterium]|nr:PAS domain-containing protein [Deltaproteobacteria bacterium]